MKLNNIVFMGTPDFAVPTLLKLIESRYKPVLCITQPDRPKGRNRRLTPTPIKITAKKERIPLLEPENINSRKVIAKIKEIEPDIIINVAYGEFLCKELLAIPKLCCINLHPSLLPKYRGPAPINYALFNGEKETGNTIFRITKKMDAGPIIFQHKIKIDEEDHFTQLQEKLAKFGAEDVFKALTAIEKNGLIEHKQDHSKASYSSKITKEKTFLDWKKSAAEIRDHVRGLAMKPGAVARFRDKTIKILRVSILPERSKEKPGKIVQIKKNLGIVVTTEDRNILLRKVQSAGKKIMDSYAFNLGARIEPGEKFDNGG